MPSKLLSTAVLPCLADVAVPRIIATTRIIGYIGLTAGLTLRRAGFTHIEDCSTADETGSGRETAHPADPSAALRTGRGSARRHSRTVSRHRLANRTELIGASAR